jgi:hypothetical protein
VGVRGHAVLLITTFTMVMAGPNLPTLLLPAYRLSLGMGPFGLTVLFSAYLVALVAVLFTVGHLARRTSPRSLVLAGLLLGVAADVLLAFTAHSLAGVLAARVLSGMSVGVATGATAVLLRHHGAQRAASATALCALLGSALGTALTAVLAQTLPLPGVLTYLVHAGACLSCAGLVAVRRALALPRRADTARADGGGSVVLPDAAGRYWVACGAGVSAWVTAGLTVALVPSYAAALLGATNLLVAAGPVVAYLLAASLGSVAAGRRTPATELALAPALMAAGLGLTALSGPWGLTVLLLLGAVITGFGQGLAFRGGLAAAQGAANALRQGEATSRYSALAYLGATVTTLGMGALTGWLGLDIAFRWAAALFGLAALALVVLARRVFAVAAGRGAAAMRVS